MNLYGDTVPRFSERSMALREGGADVFLVSMAAAGKPPLPVQDRVSQMTELALTDSSTKGV